MLLEVCANSVTSAIAAEKGGAKRVELCAGIYEGGTTPSYGDLKTARDHLTIDIHAIIRPRGGDFLYSSLEIDIMKHDIITCRQMGIDGVVFGLLHPDGSVDKVLNKELIELAYPMKTAFHRAFDMTNNAIESLEDIIDLGFDIILTSGMHNKAIDGINLIKDLILKANNRIIIMPGSGITEDNIKEIAQKTGAKNFHVSLRKIVDGSMEFRKANISMGSVTDLSEYETKITDELRVKKIVNILSEFERGF